MTLPVLFSACVAVLQFGIGVLLLGIARAPMWKGARVFAVIALSAAGYSAGNITSAYFPLSDTMRAAGLRFSYAMASLFVAAWLVYAFGDGSGTLRRVPRWVRGMAVVSLLTGAVSALLAWNIVPGAFTDVHVVWAATRYRFATPSLLGQCFAWYYLVAVAVISVRCIARERGPTSARWEYVVGFGCFFAASVIEVLVTNGLMQFFFVADFGFLAVVVPMAGELVRRFVDESQALALAKSRLTEEVQRRTTERDEVHDAWIEAERSAAMGRLAAGVGHEINNPLAYLRLNLELLGEWGRAHDAPSDFHESVDSALDGADRIRRVIDALRAYARPATGVKAPLSLLAVTQSAVGITAHQLRHAGVVDLTSGPSPTVMGEEVRLVQVMTNVLLNAGQAIAEGSAGRPGRIEVRVGGDALGNALVEVQDNGPGISRDDLRRLTQPYFTTRAHAGAMGLGLFLARGVVEQHGGTFEIESEVGAGTRVRIVLPPAVRAVGRPALESLAGRVATPRSHVTARLTPARGAMVGR